jgi:hypothetical protein
MTLARPSIGAKYRSRLTGENARVKDVQGDTVKLLIHTGDTVTQHLRDFNAEYRVVRLATR